MAVAALIGNEDAKSVLEAAKALLRSVSCSSVERRHLADNRPNPELHALSKPARIGCVDGFLSHSWSDDPDGKWAALQEWRSDVQQVLRIQDPTVWIDKFCIDQDNIDKSLKCLPVFLTSCRHFVIASGPTYLSRLWCVMEVFVFLQVGGTEERMQVHGPDLDFANFDAEKADCYMADDKERLLAVVEAGFGTLEAFTFAVRALAQDGAAHMSADASEDPTASMVWTGRRPSLVDLEDVVVITKL